MAHRLWVARYISLDDEVAANTARGDPRGFIAEVEGPTVIDEVQRAPGLLLAIKERLDRNQARGQFPPDNHPLRPERGGQGTAVLPLAWLPPRNPSSTVKGKPPRGQRPGSLMPAGL